MQDTLLSPQQVADWLNIPVKTLYEWRLRNGPVCGFRVGRHVRYERREVEDYIRQQQAAVR